MLNAVTGIRRLKTNVENKKGDHAGRHFLNLDASDT